MYLLRVASLCLALIAAAAAVPHHKREEIVMVEDLVSEQDTNVALITLSESSSSEQQEDELEEQQHKGSDDLIFPTHKAPAPTPTSIAKDSSHSEELEETEEEEELEPEQSGTPVTPIDMSAFLALIPTQQVHALVNKYYDQDREVQRAYVYFRSAHFARQLEEQQRQPEVQALLRYFNGSGLDLLQLGKALKAAILPSRNPFEGQDLDKVWEELTAVEQPNQTQPQLNGLHGLLVSVLDVLPQDQILATFFDKIESDQQFSKIIGTPKFFKVLVNLQNSKSLRLQYEHMQTLHFDISHILDTLKSYFFLSSF